MIDLIRPDVPYFTKYCLERGANIIELTIPTPDSRWVGLCNPSILLDRGELKCILRNVNFIMHASRRDNRDWTSWGPLHYIISDDEHPFLRTRNYICTIDPARASTRDYKLIDTSRFDQEPIWEFVGHEDIRLVRWNDKLYMSGVRRDDNTTGIGRMSLCELVGDQEVSRVKIDADFLGYCEKNWIPILDQPYRYLRYTYPDTEVVEVNPENGECSVVKRTHCDIPINHDMQVRGSSQVVPWKGGYIAMTHTCNLYITEHERKYGRYHFHFITWDKEWNITRISPLFCFNDSMIEFSNGLAYDEDKDLFYIPFAIQDNMSFMLTVNSDVVDSFIDSDVNGKLDNSHSFTPSNTLESYFSDHTYKSYKSLGDHYMNMSHRAAAYVCYQHAYDYTLDIDEKYDSRFLMTRALADCSHRDTDELDGWIKCTGIDEARPEAYLALSKYYEYRDRPELAFHYAKLAYMRRSRARVYYDIKYYESSYILSGLQTEHRDQMIELLRQRSVDDREYQYIYDRECAKSITRAL